MSSSPQSTAPPTTWNESSGFRETSLRNFDNPEDRAALRHIGAMLYDLALETTRAVPGEESPTRAEMRAVAADLRYVEGFLLMMRQSADESELGVMDDALARFGAEVAAGVGNLAASIERELR